MARTNGPAYFGRSVKDEEKNFIQHGHLSAVAGNELKKKFNLNYFFELFKKPDYQVKTPNGRESAVNRALDGSTHPD